MITSLFGLLSKLHTVPPKEKQVMYPATLDTFKILFKWGLLCFFNKWLKEKHNASLYLGCTNKEGQNPKRGH